MLNKKNLLKNDKIVRELFDIVFIYDGKITVALKEKLFNVLKEEGFISDKVKDITISFYPRYYESSYKDGFDVFVMEYYETRTSRNYFYISREYIERWLSNEIS